MRPGTRASGTRPSSAGIPRGTIRSLVAVVSITTMAIPDTEVAVLLLLVVVVPVVVEVLTAPTHHTLAEVTI